MPLHCARTDDEPAIEPLPDDSAAPDVAITSVYSPPPAQKPPVVKAPAPSVFDQTPAQLVEQTLRAHAEQQVRDVAEPCYPSEPCLSFPSLVCHFSSPVCCVWPSPTY